MQNFNKQSETHHEGSVERVLHAVGDVVAEGAHVLLMPYSRASEASVEQAQPARREGDRVNPTTVSLDSWVNTEHRT